MRRLTATTLSVLAALPVVIYTALHGYAGTRLDVLLLCDAVVRRQSVPSLRSYADVQPRHTTAASVGGTWHLAWGKGLSVSFEGSGGESVELLQTAPGAAFVAAAASERVAAEARGCFWVRDRVLAACVAQRVDSVTSPPGGGLLLSGGFDDCPAAQWRLHLGHDHLGHAAPPRGEAEKEAGEAEAAASAGPEAARELRFALDVEGVSPAGAALNRAQLAYGARRDAAYWGMGAQFTHFNLRGHCVPAFVSEQGIGRGARETQPVSLLLNAIGHGAGGNAYTTYAASASFVSSTGQEDGTYALALENSEPALFELASGARGCSRTIFSGGGYGAAGRDESRDLVVISLHAAAMRGRLFAPAPRRAGAEAAAKAGGEAAAEAGAGGAGAGGARAGGPGAGGAGAGGFEAEGPGLRALESLTSFVGRQRPLPEWADQGVILGLQGGAEKVLAVVRASEEAGVPVTGVWLQDWMGKRHTALGDRLWWNWILDDHAVLGSYAAWEEMREALGSVRLLAYANSFLADPEAAAPPGTETATAARWRRSLFAEAVAGGYVIAARAEGGAGTAGTLLAGTGTAATRQAAEGAPSEARRSSAAPSGAEAHLLESVGFKAALLDVTHPQAREWMIESVLRGEMLSHAHASGWMADFGEALPCEGVALHDGREACAYHNQYPVDWAAINREALRRAGKEEQVFFFSRSGFTTSPSVSPLFWLGDQLPTWDERDGMASALSGTLSSGLSGYALTHADLGGYTGAHLALPLPFLGRTLPLVRLVRSRELLLRWQEMGCFAGAVYRSHEGLLPAAFHQPWSDNATLAHLSRFARLFVALRPYRRALMAEAHQRGWPLARHPVLHYPRHTALLADGEAAAEGGGDEGGGGGEGGGDGRVRQFMLGADLMVLPVLAPGVASVRGYFPCGRWLYLWSAEGAEEEEALDACAPHLGAGAAGGGPLQGRWLTVPAPLGRPAVYARAAALHGTYAALRRRMREAGLLAPYSFAHAAASPSERAASAP